ncbi:hypothetical protein GCM10022254_49290 [Actinomadura meridiana]|uniref:MmyB-like transcription regulator ligand binding domain-containing protein n=1 Tax=Actinomadura meridiana TaxID=559626 RepID=A0ABP8CCE9_9ACTN
MGQLHVHKINDIHVEFTRHPRLDKRLRTPGRPNRTKNPPRLPRRAGIERFVHPDTGELRLAYETLALPIADEQALIAYLPADDATSEALNHLRPGRLRAVSGRR